MEALLFNVIVKTFPCIAGRIIYDPGFVSNSSYLTLFKEFLMNKDPFWMRYLPIFIREKLTGRVDFFSIIHNSCWLLFDKMIRSLLGLIVGAWVARYLGPVQYGELAYIFAFIAFFQALAPLGLDNVIVRDLAIGKEGRGKSLGSVLVLRFVSGIVLWFSAILIIFLYYGLYNKYTLLTFVMGFVLIVQAADTVDLWFQSQGQNRRTVFAKLTAYVVSNLLKIFLILNNAPLLFFAFSLAIEGLISSLALAYSYKKYPAKEKWFFSYEYAIKVLSQSWPLMFSCLSMYLYMRIDQVFIKHYAGDRELGIYATVLPFSIIFQFIPMTLLTTISPYMAKLKSTSEIMYMDFLKNIFWLFSLIGWAVSIIVFILSQNIIDIFLGDMYSDGAFVLSIHVFSNIFVNLGIAQSLWIINEKKTRISLYKTILGAVVCIVGNLIFLPKYGIYGAAAISVISHLVAGVLSNYFFAKDIFKLQLKSLLLIR